MAIFQFGNTTRLVPLGLFIDLIADTHRSKALDFAKRTSLLHRQIVKLPDHGPVRNSIPALLPENSNGILTPEAFSKALMTSRTDAPEKKQNV